MKNSNFKFRKSLARFTFGLIVIGSVLFGINLLSQQSEASTPSNGTLTETSGPQIYSAGPFNVANPTPITMVDTGPRCNANTNPCDSYNLNVTLPTGYRAAHPNVSMKVTMSWGDTGTGNSDYDLYIYKGTVTTLSGAMPADAKSASGSNPEVANFSPLTDGTQAYTIKIVPYTPTGETLNVKIELLPGAPPTPGGGGVGCTINCGNFGAADPTIPGNPRYLNFYAPNGSKGQGGSGEFNIGYDAKTKRIMVMNSGPILRLTTPENLTPAKPECCEAMWEDKSATVTNTGLDPILWTDGGYFGKVMNVNSAYIPGSGRTYASNATAGANALYAYTDNDGDSYTQVGAAPPDGADHQTIGTGPFPASLAPLLTTPLNNGKFVLYCSQDLVGSNCQRSLDNGISYANPNPATGPGTLNSQGCGGLHGHTRIAPDGTAWLPDKSCGSKQGGGISLDSSTTPWTEFSVSKPVADANGPAFTTTPQANGADPSIALDADSTAYYCYVNSEAGGLEGHAHVAVGKRVPGTTTINWIRDTDVGITHGIVNAAHTEAIGGSSGRASCGFMGTNVGGDYQPNNFAGKWYVFIATTYDEGVSWVTVNATPNDPVQSMSGIWQQGGSATDRNLLDFNEITVDEKGRVIYGYSDGCTSGPCIGGTGANDFNAYMRVARQSGGKTLFDGTTVSEPAAPKPACLSGVRDTATGSHLSWKIPDNGGSDITGYVILRSTASGGESVLVANTGSDKNTYDDLTAANNTPHYYYTIQAINANGTVIGSMSNEVDLIATAPPIVENACLLNGLTILTDPMGDNLDMVAGHDVRSLQIGEPFANAPNKVVFTLKMQSLATVPPNTQFPIVFNAPNGTSYTARMTNVPTDGATGGTPIFQIGPTAGTLVAADPASSFNADGTIKIVFPLSAIGSPTVGTNLTNFLVRIRESAVASSITPDNMPDSLAPTGSYTLIGNASCGVPLGLESDVLGNTVLHTTDGIVDSTDVAQTRRFQTGFDQPYSTGEFQRVDSAPLATFGDGFVDALDVAQARRYQAGLDPVKPAAGPTAPGASPIQSASSEKLSSSSRDNNLALKGTVVKSGVIRVVSQKAAPGDTVTVGLETDAKGTESIYGFTLNYDASLLTYVPNSTVVGSGASEASVMTNAETPGQIGLSVDFAGRTIAPGRGKQLMTMQFKVAEGGRGGSAALIFGDELAKRSVASNPMTGEVRSVATGFVNGTVEVAAIKPRLSGRVVSALGRGVAGAEVRLTDSNNRQLTIRTNSFGYYYFENLVAGETYSIATTHPRFRFAPQAVIVNAADEETNVTAAP